MELTAIVVYTIGFTKSGQIKQSADADFLPYCFDNILELDE